MLEGIRNACKRTGVSLGEYLCVMWPKANIITIPNETRSRIHCCHSGHFKASDSRIWNWSALLLHNYTCNNLYPVFKAGFFSPRFAFPVLSFVQSFAYLPCRIVVEYLTGKLLPAWVYLGCVNDSNKQIMLTAANRVTCYAWEDCFSCNSSMTMKQLLKARLFAAE